MDCNWSIQKQSDEKFMRLAIEQAMISASEGEVPVGAVVVKDGEVISVGRNRRELGKNALAHAEEQTADLFEHGEGHQYTEHLALAKCLRQPDAFRDADQNSRSNQGEIEDTGQFGQVAKGTYWEAQRSDDANPAVPDRGVFLVGIQKRDQTVPALLARFTQDTPSADEQQKSEEQNSGVDVIF